MQQHDFHPEAYNVITELARLKHDGMSSLTQEQRSSVVEAFLQDGINDVYKDGFVDVLLCDNIAALFSEFIRRDLRGDEFREKLFAAIETKYEDLFDELFNEAHEELSIGHGVGWLEELKQWDDLERARDMAAEIQRFNFN